MTQHVRGFLPPTERGGHRHLSSLFCSRGCAEVGMQRSVLGPWPGARSSSGRRTWAHSSLWGAAHETVPRITKRSPTFQLPNWAGAPPQALSFTPQHGSFYSEFFRLPWELNSDLPSAGSSLRHCHHIILSPIHTPTTSSTARVPPANPAPHSRAAIYPELSSCCFSPPRATRTQEAARKTLLYFRGCAVLDCKSRVLLWDRANNQFVC